MILTCETHENRMNIMRFTYIISNRMILTRFLKRMKIMRLSYEYHTNQKV